MPIDHRITLIPQSTATSCWAAAASMLHGDRTVGSTGAKTKGGGLGSSPSNVRAFADENGFRMLSLCTLSPTALDQLLQAGPLMFCGAVPNTHCYVVGGINGDNIHIYDPWPVGVGADRWISYAQLMTKFPLGAIYILQKSGYY
jgi:hypothetical protein